MKRLTIAFCAVILTAAISAPALAAIVYSGSQDVTLAVGPMYTMASRTIQLGGMSADWDDFRVDLWLDMGMPGSMMMGMGTRLAIYAPRGMGMPNTMGMAMGMGGILGMAGMAMNLPMGAPIAADSFFDVFTELGKFGEDGGYIGLRTGMGNLGWLHMLSQSNIGTQMHSVTFDGWAYEAQPGVPIGAGEGGPCDWRPGAPHKMHWPQLPDLGFTGIDIAVTQTTLADDFRCTATGPIRDIHIWGSFDKDILPKEGPDGLTFEVSIYSDVPATDKQWSRPGGQLWTRTFKPGEYTVRRVSNGPEDWYDPAKGLYVSANHRYAFQYNFCIDRDPFTQEEGKIYWLAVRETSATTNYSFGWKTTTRELRWNDDAVYYQSNSAGWTEMAYPKGHKYVGASLDLAFVITDGSNLPANRDLGDAPDSSNSIPGQKMLAYPSGVFAGFPTVYQGGSPPYGPMHQLPRDMYYLGKWVSLETEADIGVDDDGITNIDPLNDIPNRDGADDGLKLPVSMPPCQATTLDYFVTMTGTSAQRPYVNVWCDWNRDGDWDDKVVCPDGTEVPEWAVQNQVIALSAPGVYTFTTPSFRSWHPGKDKIDPMWLRISIADRPWAPTSGVPSTGGCGPATGYKYGETEDYYLQFNDLPLPVKYDWGDAPETAAAAGYPTLAASNGARHVIAGPWLGNEKDKPDAEVDGQPDADALGDDNAGSDDENGVSLLPLFPGLPAAATVEVSGGGGVVQAWIDFNIDRAWQGSEKIFDGFLPDGVHTINFTTPGAAVIGQTFARFRISRQGGLGPEGEAKDGEVEDHRLWIVAQPDASKQWCQLPDLTPEGIDIRIDNGENLPRIVADDFECRQPGRLTHIRLWGSWKDDHKGEIKTIHVRIHPDDPIGPEGPDGKNKYSMPAPETLWEREFHTGQFAEELYHTGDIAGEWWWDPAQGDAIPGGDKQVWQLDIEVDPGNAFVQQGSSASPRIYWLEVSAETADGQLGWKTRRWPEHFMDDAVFSAGIIVQVGWHELHYPLGHKYFSVERNSIDMAFCLLFTVDTTQPTSQAVALTQCPPVQTTCPATVTQCQAVRTACPVVETSCPATDTKCPVVLTQCPPSLTKCPPTATACQAVQTQCPATDTECWVEQTKCPVYETRCPPVETKCPPTDTKCWQEQTKCPVYETRCPPVQTKCPPTDTECHVIQTQCPATDTECWVEQTKCPVYETRCPPVQTKCPATLTECQQATTQCPTLKTYCPPADTQCPQEQTKCPPMETRCPVVSTTCPPVLTQCPQTLTVCLHEPTFCPTTPTQCSPVCGPLQSSESAGDVSTLQSGSACPTVEADCHTVDEYLVIAQAAR